MQGSAFNPSGARTIVAWLARACSLGVLAVALSGTMPASAADNSTTQFGPPDSWVRPHFFDQQSTANLPDASADQHWLLVERQINAQQNETFVHSARQVLTADGVQNGSTLTIDFNPGYETLTWHWARIWRDGQHLERLDTNNVKVVQQEQELDQFVLNGQKSAVLVLDDVRVGDIIDYAYSVKGANPVFDPYFSDEVPVQMADPVERLFTRVVWPRQRHLYAKPHGCYVQPAATAGKGNIEYVWDLRQVPGLALEDSLPAWYEPEPWVQLSEFQTWAAVNQWASGLFRVTSPCSPSLAQKIAEWKQIPDQEQQILAVLRFVQEEVRYFGIEIGASTEKPTDPSTVFKRRFGDCKDKSWLFVTILRALGIEAYPVLVNSTLRRAIEDWQPSSDAFDHCIATVMCNDQMYWVDPTMNYQRGSLAEHYLPAYGCGLVISPATTGLTAIPQTTGLPRTTTTEYFQIRGNTEPADLKVVTIAEGSAADDLRQLFATTKLTDIEKNYTHFYSDLYPGIKMSSPVVIDDNEQEDTVQTTEFYSIDKIWTVSGKDRNYSCTFYPSTIAGLLKTPVDTDRKLPLGINFPDHQILRTEITLPKEWQTDANAKTINDPAFFFRKEYRSAGNKIVMEYEYQSLADSVSPDLTGAYIDHLNQCSQGLGYTLFWR
jgi:transglutaminase-like putative cysteine protease